MPRLKMNEKSRYKQTVLRVGPESGYIGQESTIRIMSSYEMKAVRIIKTLFKAGRIKGWTSEETVIQYELPTDGSIHKYYVDFTLLMTDGSYLHIEVKPSSECFPPVQPRKTSPKSIENYKNQVQTFIKNQAKWEATEKWCLNESKRSGIQHRFIKWTEVELHL